MDNCYCGAATPFSECCEPLIKGDAEAQTAEALMRSRYSAFVKAEVNYILNTVHPDKKTEDDEKSIRSWAEKSDWIKFELIESTNGGPDDDEGQVEFIAHFRAKEKRQQHHEIAIFKKLENKWYFFEAETPEVKQVIRETPKIGRNEPCTCGSGKKYKKCCGK